MPLPHWAHVTCLFSTVLPEEAWGLWPGVSLSPPIRRPVITSVAPDSGVALQRVTLVFTGGNLLTGLSRVDMGAGIIVNAITWIPPNQTYGQHQYYHFGAGGNAQDSSLKRSPRWRDFRQRINFQVVIPPDALSDSRITGGRSAVARYRRDFQLASAG